MHPDVVPVERDVHGPERHGRSLYLAKHRGEPFGKRHAAFLDPDDDDIFQPTVTLDDLVRDAHERPSNLVAVHDLSTGNKKRAL